MSEIDPQLQAKVSKIIMEATIKVSLALNKFCEAILEAKGNLIKFGDLAYRLTSPEHYREVVRRGIENLFKGE